MASASARSHERRAAVSTDWRPTAALRSLRTRAAMLAGARAFFSERRVLEVETPVLSAAAVSDPQIESLRTTVAGMPAALYLSTSPEFAMKRLLAAGSGDIYHIGKVFRDGEQGRWHNPEFTLVEWYRLGFDDAAMMKETEALVTRLLAPYRRLAAARRISYTEALQVHAGIDWTGADEAELARAAAAAGIVCDAALDRDARLDLLMGLVVGPQLGLQDTPAFLCDYPPSQASLARLKPGTPPVAARFELYLDGLELANGFHELADAQEQRRRFEADLATRRRRGQPLAPLDERLLDALAHGLPDCAGVALGFDRLVALAVGAGSLRGSMAFPIGNA
jgi:elongation factor P--(R)-beta-lysine ligase